MALELQIWLSSKADGGTDLQFVLSCYAEAGLDESDFDEAAKERVLQALAVPNEMNDLVVLHTWSLLASSAAVAIRLGCQKVAWSDDYLRDWQMTIDQVVALYQLLSAELGADNAELNFYFGQLLAQLDLEAKLAGPRGDEPQVVAPFWQEQLNDAVFMFGAEPGS